MTHCIFCHDPATHIIRRDDGNIEMAYPYAPTCPFCAQKLLNFCEGLQTVIGRVSNNRDAFPKISKKDYKAAVREVERITNARFR